MCIYKSWKNLLILQKVVERKNDSKKISPKKVLKVLLAGLLLLVK